VRTKAYTIYECILNTYVSMIYILLIIYYNRLVIRGFEYISGRIFPMSLLLRDTGFFLFKINWLYIFNKSQIIFHYNSLDILNEFIIFGIRIKKDLNKIFKVLVYNGIW